MLRHALDLSAEYIAKAQETSGPEKGPRRIKEKETPETHVKDAGKGSRDSAQAGDELRQQKRHRGKRQAYLLGENPSEQQNVTVMEQKFESAVHGWAASGISVISLRKE